MAVDRSKLMEMLGGGAPAGAGDLLGGGAAPVGTDAIPTPDLEGAGGVPPGGAVPEPPLGAGGPSGAPIPEPGGIEAILGAPDMDPAERAKLEAELAMAAREKMLQGGLG